MIKDELAKFSDAIADLVEGLSNRVSHLEAEAVKHGWEPPPPPLPPPPPKKGAE